MKLVKIHNQDNVAVAVTDIAAGEKLELAGVDLTASQAIPKGHKICLTPVSTGDNLIKYGFPIGHAVQPIAAGQWVHSHNLGTNLKDQLEYEFHPASASAGKPLTPRIFQGYKRADGRVGTRNEIWVIPTVSCVNRNAQIIAKLAMEKYTGTPNLDGVFELTHPYGCSQMGEDLENTQRLLADLVNHPNAGAVLVLGLGCENNHIAVFKEFIGCFDPNRVKFLEAQGVDDEIATGLEIIGELIQEVQKTSRTECPVSDLVVGLKCGGSDGFSGITGNPLVGLVSDRIIDMGGSTILTEVPEMFGAETLLMDRAVDEGVFQEIIQLINGFKQYYQDYDQPVYENPSPGNKKGGISTLEEKSLGCTQKGGIAPVVDVLHYGRCHRKKGLTLLWGPGNDMIAVTGLAASGCQLILFTTGRGTPLGSVVPTLKIATNSDLFRRKSNWMDFDAGRLLDGVSLLALRNELLDVVIAAASGLPTRSEKMGFREISIFKEGVIL